MNTSIPSPHQSIPFAQPTRSRRVHDALSEYFASRPYHARYTTYLSPTRARMLHTTRPDMIVIEVASCHPLRSALIAYPLSSSRPRLALLQCPPDFDLKHTHSPARNGGLIAWSGLLPRTSHYLQVMTRDLSTSRVSAS